MRRIKDDSHVFFPACSHFPPVSGNEVKPPSTSPWRGEHLAYLSRSGMVAGGSCWQGRSA